MSLRKMKFISLVTLWDCHKFLVHNLATSWDYHKFLVHNHVTICRAWHFVDFIKTSYISKLHIVPDLTFDVVETTFLVYLCGVNEYCRTLERGK